MLMSRNRMDSTSFVLCWTDSGPPMFVRVSVDVFLSMVQGFYIRRAFLMWMEARAPAAACLQGKCVATRLGSDCLVACGCWCEIQETKP